MKIKMQTQKLHVEKLGKTNVHFPFQSSIIYVFECENYICMNLIIFLNLQMETKKTN